MSEWHEERYEARNEALAEASGDCETEKEELEAENLALDDEIKELKEANRLMTNRIVRYLNIIQVKDDLLEDLRGKILERDEKLEKQAEVYLRRLKELGYIEEVPE